MATTIFLTTAGTFNWAVPIDWNNANNTIECLGAGANGVGDQRNANAGGGGAYARINNLALTPGTNVSYHIGSPGNGDTTFNGTSLGACSVGAKGAVGTTGGAAGSSVGTIKYSGGTGIYGGGGGAGPYGGGNNGSSSTGGGGGSGDVGNGGAGGNSSSNGSAGSEWGSSRGSGGGGACGFGAVTGLGATATASASNGGNGGAYGAGGGVGGYARAGNGSTAIGVPGTGSGGLIKITYVPTVATATTLSSSMNPGALGRPVTFTASVTSGATGTVTFKDGSTILGTTSLTGNIAQLTTSSLSLGTHTIQAIYNGDATYASSNTSMTETIKVFGQPFKFFINY